MNLASAMMSDNCPYGMFFPWSFPAKASQQYIAAGTISLALMPPRESWLQPRLCQQHWHLFEKDLLLPFMLAENAVLLQHIELLSKHNLVVVAACMNLASNAVYLRVCLVAQDAEPDTQQLAARTRDALKFLMMRVIVNASCWHGGSGHDDGDHKYLIGGTRDTRTMAEIYSELASPSADMSTELSPAIAQSVRGVLETGKINGLQSRLYLYQRQTVGTMLLKELDPKSQNDPLYLTMEGPKGNTFYLQPTTMKAVRERRFVSKTRGGVLCEELGTGKTVMILSLILATKYELPEPDEHAVAPRTLLTPLALRYFPDEAFRDARSFLSKPRLRLAHQEHPPDATQAHSRFPSLAEYAMHSISVSSTSRRHRFIYQNPCKPRLVDQSTHSDLFAQMAGITPFYLVHSLHKSHGTRSTRNYQTADAAARRAVALSSATLVVVPPNLFAQWNNEIYKHCGTSGLRVGTFCGKDKLPPAAELASLYDIILIDQNRFTAEIKKSNIEKHMEATKTLYHCLCPPIVEGSRIPRCTCTPRDDPKFSSLLQIRWKRLVIDEGHVAAAPFTDVNLFAEKLNVERRWIVTGTPTTHLLGLSFGQTSVQHAPDEPSVNVDHDGDVSMDTVDNSMVVSDTSIDDDDYRPRRWTSSDAEDLRKLEHMLRDFLQVLDCAGRNDWFKNLVRAPLMGSPCPAPGAIEVLQQVMEAHFVRHRISDVEKDIVLKPMQHEQVLLNLLPHAIKSYNVMQAQWLMNAIDSERKDQDYMFHPNNADVLRKAIEQLQQVLFWNPDNDLYGAKSTYNYSAKIIDKAQERLTAQQQLQDTSQEGKDSVASRTEDLAILKKARHHLELALEDAHWRASMHTIGDVPYEAFQLPSTLHGAWSQFSADSQSPSIFVHASNLLRLRSLVMRKPLTTEELLATWGGLFAELEQLQTRHAQVKGRLAKRTKARKNEAQAADEDPIRMRHGIGRASAAPLSRSELEEEQKTLAEAINDTISKLREKEAPIDTDKKSTTLHETPSTLVSRSPVANVLVGSSASSKLNFILDEVLRYSKEEKFLIFSSMPLSLALVKESLELAGIPCLEFTSRNKTKVRTDNVMTFETSSTYRVFLMELKHGARGLNLTSASRIIFCEPVWQPDVESQAIKRVHRIGQQRNVTVKTLAIRHTAEEKMLEQRRVLNGEQPPTSNWTEQNEMRRFIANPQFLAVQPNHDAGTPALRFPLFSPPAANTHDANGTVGGINPQVHEDTENADAGSSSNKRLKLRFDTST